VWVEDENGARLDNSESNVGREATQKLRLGAAEKRENLQDQGKILMRKGVLSAFQQKGNFFWG